MNRMSLKVKFSFEKEKHDLHRPEVCCCERIEIEGEVALATFATSSPELHPDLRR
jgi:hypothetical protein